MKNTIINTIKDIVIIIVGAFIYAISMYVFTIPAKLAPGGVSGISSIIQNIWHFNASYTILICNVPIIIASFVFLTKKFTILSILGIVVSSAFIKMFDALDFYTFYIETEPLYALVAGGALSGIGIGFMIVGGGSSGGTDIISMLVQKKNPATSISWIILYMNIAVIVGSGILYYLVLHESLTKILLIMIASLLEVFVSSKSMDFILNGLNSSVKFEIICKDATKLSDEIMNELHRGVTVVKCIGEYQKQEHEMLVCIVSRRQVATLKKIIKRVEPNAFAYSIQTREVLGKGFRRNI